MKKHANPPRSSEKQNKGPPKKKEEPMEKFFNEPKKLKNIPVNRESCPDCGAEGEHECLARTWAIKKARGEDVDKPVKVSEPGNRDLQEGKAGPQNIDVPGQLSGGGSGVPPKGSKAS